MAKHNTARLQESEIQRKQAITMVSDVRTATLKLKEKGLMPLILYKK